MLIYTILFISALFAGISVDQGALSNVFWAIFQPIEMQYKWVKDHLNLKAAVINVFVLID